MQKRDTFDAFTALLAVVTDAIGIYGAFLLAYWIRFDSGWIPVPKGIPPIQGYLYGFLIGTGLFLLIYASLGLYRRPQSGSFVDKIPRLIRANTIGLLLSVALFSMVRTEPPFSRLVAVISYFTIGYVILLLRFLMHQLEIHLARMNRRVNRVAVVGTDSIAFRLRQALEHDPRLRAKVTAFFLVSDRPRDQLIPRHLVRPGVEDLQPAVEAGEFDAVVLTDTSLSHAEMVEIIGCCERHLVNFHLVPDLFRLLTSSVEVQTVDGIPLLGVGRWPLDQLWNRMLKRIEDLVCAALGLVVAGPIMAAAAVLIRLDSPGPVLYRQQRCGERGKLFTLYKLRSMRVDAEAASGPQWTTANDPRRTRIGTVLRRYNIDELPQLLNVLTGDMSLVGPRPERPHFVEQFREELAGYMWRHVHKPGMTGWAQVNGLRGDTSIPERIKHDLYYLENWSLAFDFKILLLTLLTRENAS